MERQCDCCGRMAWCIHTIFVCGLETAACCTCRGWEIEDCHECSEPEPERDGYAVGFCA